MGYGNQSTNQIQNSLGLMDRLESHLNTAGKLFVFNKQV